LTSLVDPDAGLPEYRDLGIEAEVVPGGQLGALGHPAALADQILLGRS
jgi:hypothetical protein